MGNITCRLKACFLNTLSFMWVPRFSSTSTVTAQFARQTHWIRVTINWWE